MPAKGASTVPERADRSTLSLVPADLVDSLSAEVPKWLRGLRGTARPEPGSQSFAKALVRAVADPRNVSVGANQHRRGRRDCAEHRELPHTSVSSVDPLHPLRPWTDVEGAGLTEIEQHRSGIVEQAEHPPWAAFGPSSHS